MSIARNIQISYFMNRDCFVSRSDVILSFVEKLDAQNQKHEMVKVVQIRKSDYGQDRKERNGKPKEWQTCSQVQSDD